MAQILTRKRALEIMAGFPLARVLVIGDIMIDHFIWGKVVRISPEAPVPVVDVKADDLMLGGCANVLNNIFSMGGKACVTGVIGADVMGDKVREEFRKRHISTQGLVAEPRRPTSLKTRIVAHQQQVVRFDRESRTPIREESVRHILSYLRNLRDSLGAVVISDYGKGVVTPALLDGVRTEIS
ncbi:MAG: PfkB family carbohydrate kinase, partial [Syntrophales bacterium]|nr:PfkB family carbohydrate kinase [Syntrophales bacterium]